jgi:hypothetical protein
MNAPDRDRDQSTVDSDAVRHWLVSLQQRIVAELEAADGSHFHSDVWSRESATPGPASATTGSGPTTTGSAPAAEPTLTGGGGTATAARRFSCSAFFWAASIPSLVNSNCWA